MLIARAPVRISFAGGGTDLPAYFMQYGGAVISTSIDHYVYVILTVTGRPDLQITSSDYRTFFRHQGGEVLFWEGDLNLPKAILHEFGIHSGLSMFIASQVPPGTGLGSSSTVTVACIKAVSAACGVALTKQQIGEMATRIELEKLNMPIGYQDQFAAAVGGLNRYDFTAEGTIVTPLNVSMATRQALESRLLLFFTGQSRDSTAILARQTENTKSKSSKPLDALHRVRGMVDEVQDILERGDLDAFGAMLHAGWEEKKKFATGISNERIDRLYDLARERGALGGKLTGAGGGGFLMLFSQPGTQDDITAALEAEGLRRMNFYFDHAGARVMVNAGLQLDDSHRHPALS